LKTLLFIPAVLLLLAGAYWATMAGLGMQFHRRELIAAVAICIVSGEVALMPAAMLRNSDPATVSQAGLAGTVIHMFLTLLLAAIAWISKVLVNKQLFLFMLLAFFWVSLIVLVVAMIRLVRGSAVKRAG
jgi:hypothetical protein